MSTAAAAGSAPAISNASASGPKAPIPSCTAFTPESQEPGTPAYGSCVANAACVRACGAKLGDAIAGAHEPQDDGCKGDAECSQREQALRVNTANLQVGPFVGCLQLCWRPKASGECRWDQDCAASGPCSVGVCNEGTCKQVPQEGARCTDANGAVGICEKNQCTRPDEVLRYCGELVGSDARRDWDLGVNYAERCRRGEFCSPNLSVLRRGLAWRMLYCLSHVLETAVPNTVPLQP